MQRKRHGNSGILFAARRWSETLSEISRKIGLAGLVTVQAVIMPAPAQNQAAFGSGTWARSSCIRNNP